MVTESNVLWFHFFLFYLFFYYDNRSDQLRPDTGVDSLIHRTREKNQNNQQKKE